MHRAILYVTATLSLIATSGVVMAQAEPKEVVDPAPSGHEQSVMSVNRDTGASVTMPGKDSHQSSVTTTEGNRVRLDYDTGHQQPGRENDTTIVTDPK